MAKHKEESALTVHESAVPALMSDFAADAGAGFEDMTAQDYSLPFIILLQAMSPQLQEDNTLYNENARPGWMINTVTGEAFKEMRIIPCAFAFRVNERKPREQGGGFVARHERGQEPDHKVLVDANGKKRRVTATGNELIDTAYHYVLVVDDDGIPHPAVMAFRSTGLTESKNWNAKLDSLRMKDVSGAVFKPPRYASIYKVTSGKKSNEFGTWYSYILDREGDVNDPALYATAKAFHETALSKKLAEEAPEEKRADAADDVM